MPIISGGHLARSTHFINRTQELKSLENFWDAGRQAVVAVIGLGGIGKTALVAEFLRQITSDPDRSPNIVFVWNCYENPDPRSLLNNIYETISGDEPSRYQTAELADQAATLLLTRKRALLILDGFEIVSDPIVSTFTMRALRGDAKFIITSRISPAFFDYCINVSGLTPAAGEQLLRRTNLAGSPDEYQELVTAVHGHPLFLDLIATLLQLRSATQTSGVLKSVRAEVRSFASLEKTITRVIGTIDNSLSGTERGLLARLSLFRSGVSVEDIELLFAQSEDATVSGPLANLTNLAISDLLASLQHKGLIVVIATSQSTLFSVHPILRDYFQGAIPDRGPLHKQLGDHYINLLDVKDQPLSFETAEIIMEIVYQLTQSKNTSVEDIKKLAARLPREQTPMMRAYSSLLDAALHMEPRAKIIAHETKPRLRAFVSYVRDDARQVTKLRSDLEKHEIDVWQDTDRLIPGRRWKNEIRNAIKSGDFFIACFSDNYAARSRTYMREELLLAIEELRLRPADRTWFIPVMLTPTEIPTISVGAGETLRDFQWVNLYDGWDEGISSLVRAFS